MAEKLLEVKNLHKYFPVKGVKGPGVQAVENVSLFINKGETLGLVGERSFYVSMSLPQARSSIMASPFMRGSIPLNGRKRRTARAFW